MVRIRRPQSRQHLRDTSIHHSVNNTNSQREQSINNLEDLLIEEPFYGRHLLPRGALHVLAGTLAMSPSLPAAPRIHTSSASTCASPGIISTSCSAAAPETDVHTPFQCPSLLSLSLSTLGRHVTKFVKCCGKLDFLPTDVRGCLIAAAR